MYEYCSQNIALVSSQTGLAWWTTFVEPRVAWCSWSVALPSSNNTIYTRLEVAINPDLDLVEVISPYCSLLCVMPIFRFCVTSLSRCWFESPQWTECFQSICCVKWRHRRNSWNTHVWKELFSKRVSLFSKLFSGDALLTLFGRSGKRCCCGWDFWNLQNSSRLRVKQSIP